MLQASGQDNSTADCHTPGEAASSQGQGGSSGPQATGNRSAAQSPRRGRAEGGPPKLKPANVLNTLLSPVLTLLHGGSGKGQEQQHAEQQQQQPGMPAPESGSVLLEVRMARLQQRHGHCLPLCRLLRGFLPDMQHSHQ